MVDANQAWDLGTATEMAAAFVDFDLGWLEEPLRADRPWSEWQQLARTSAFALAAGENMAAASSFDAALESKALGVVQPDLAKWGGFTGCLPVAKNILSHRARFCPHFLGAGIGLLASAHLLAAVGGNGMLEIDANDNALRTLTCGPLASILEGRASLGTAPGLGLAPDQQTLSEFLVAH